MRFILVLILLGGAANLQAMHQQPDRSCTPCILVSMTVASWLSTLIGDVVALHGLNKAIDLKRPARPTQVVTTNQDLAVAGLVLTVTNAMTGGLLYQAQGHPVFATIFALNFLGSVGTSLSSGIWTWVHRAELEKFELSEIMTGPIISAVGVGILIPSSILGLRHWYRSLELPQSF